MNDPEMDKDFHVLALDDICLLDHPGKTSMVVYFGGCNLKCDYCHNAAAMNCGTLWTPEYMDKRISGVLNFVEAIVFSGGECTEQPAALRRYAKMAHDMGKEVAIETNGTHPEVIRDMLARKLVDKVYCDIKAPCGYLHRLEKHIGTDGSYDRLVRQVMVHSSGKLELRIVCFGSFADEAYIKAIDEMIPRQCVCDLTLMQGKLTSTYKDDVMSPKELKALAKHLNKPGNIYVNSTKGRELVHTNDRKDLQ